MTPTPPTQKVKGLEFIYDTDHWQELTQWTDSSHSIARQRPFGWPLLVLADSLIL